MKTAKAVGDGHVSDELLGKVNRKVDEIVRRMKGKNKPLDPDWVLLQLQNTVEGPQWLVWESVMPGEGKYRDIQKFADALDLKGWDTDQSVLELLEKYVFTEAREKRVAELVLVTATDLKLPLCNGGAGFKLGDAFERARKWGLQLCPLEAGLLGLLKVKDHEDDYLVAMEPIFDDENQPDILWLNSIMNESLSIHDAFPKTVVDSDTKLIFCRQVRKHPSAFQKGIEKFFADRTG